MTTPARMPESDDYTFWGLIVVSAILAVLDYPLLGLAIFGWALFLRCR